MQNSSKHLTEQQLKETFALFDKDRDGFISAEELTTVMRSIGHNANPSELRELMNNAHGSGTYTSRDGKIDFELFCSLMDQKMKDVDSEAELKDAFRVLDELGKGYIGVKELRLICQNLGEELDEEQVYSMVCEGISNFDGKIYYDGFKKIMIAH
mmetsp:Transcript_30853/g.51053  ORF Transcript_30853/g.51053 Transcript_30853/m.51053 type:complete len:155 (+) Transcript_30853:16-480(+)|eukprot:CAMPEP_0119299038 /NCGR_PEP_ID=MMETSP1333-20130426/1155_1 /TAXON_ID=418940 /ORGANISM="Scyphosphaera apsteinii, Strain RCC1455" /LENGTH=154 /DNA_ID=CAMNT_0007300321 /DNA_START=16 /DNA_END=480 /DNA_ORIENTATION=+